MTREVKGGSAQERILRLLAERYPVTVDEVALALNLRPDVTRLEVKRLQSQGLVVVESLDRKQYVALSGSGYRFIGVNPSEAAAYRKRHKLPPATARPDDDPAFM